MSRTSLNILLQQTIGLRRTIVPLLLTLLVVSCGEKPKTEAKMTNVMFRKDGDLTIKNTDGTAVVSIDIEIADSPNSRETGLMGRPSLGQNDGMLFIFEEDQYLSFWMMNTMIPLDMMFIDSKGKIITIHRNTVPFSQGSYASSDLGRYVLEVNAGFCDAHGIVEGDVIDWKRTSAKE